MIAAGAEEAIERAVAEVNGTATDASWDPLMSAHWMICGRALRFCGLGLCTGDYCPVCSVMANFDGKPDAAGRVWSAPEIEDAWITGPADAALEYAIGKGLVTLQVVQ